MKHLTFVALMLILLSSCASQTSLPEPEAAENSLVVGNLVLDFPDGFFDLSARKIDSRVYVNIRNVTKNSTFSTMTASSGMFSFLSNGSDEYVLESYEYRFKESGSYSLGVQPINVKFVATPGRVIYIGHITHTWAEPKESESSDRGATWDFKNSWATKWDEDAVLSYITEKNPKSMWLSREVFVVWLRAAK